MFTDIQVMSCTYNKQSSVVIPNTSCYYSLLLLTVTCKAVTDTVSHWLEGTAPCVVNLQLNNR